MRALREAAVLLVVALVPAALAVMLHPQLHDRASAGLEPGAVRLATAQSWAPDVLWIDARPAADFAQGHIPGAVHLDEADFSAAVGDILAAWRPGQRLVVYCSSTSCSTSREVAERLRAAGFNDVHSLHGGWEAWEEAGR